jgi:hypothetical protein
MAAQRARAGGLSPPGGSRVPAAAEEGQLGPAHVEGPGVARLTSIAGFTLQLAAITAAGVVIAYVSMAFWYWRSRIPTLNTDAPISACYRAPPPGACLSLTPTSLCRVTVCRTSVVPTLVGVVPTIVGCRVVVDYARSSSLRRGSRLESEVASKRETGRRYTAEPVRMERALGVLASIRR